MSTLARLSGAKNSGSSLASLSGSYSQPAYAATLAITPPYQSAYRLVIPAALTGAMSITTIVGNGIADTVAPFAGDVIEFLFNAATTQVVTFSTGFASTGTLSVTGTKYASIVFVFNGTIWVERSRAVTA